MSRAFITVTLSIALGCSTGVHANEIPNARACVAVFLETGEDVSVREHVGESGFAAYATYDPDGWPSITYAPTYFTLPPIVQTFLSLHECGHLALRTSNEFLANCYALSQRRWTSAEIELIALSHRAVGRLGPQYGGSGASFWEGTKALCPQYLR